MRNYLTILFLLTSLYSFSQSKAVEKIIQAGNEYYRQQQFAKATEQYNKAVEAEPSNKTAQFNQANALYKQDKKVQAAELFAQVAKDATDKEVRSKAFYNKGVILSQQKNLEESIEAYKDALRNNPADREARENLQKALLELKKKNAEKKKDDQQKKKKEEQKKQPQSKLSPKEADQRLKLLQQKEKEVQQRVQKEKIKTGGSQAKDW
ncbi:MAG: tetratricopeptide repeat protein [Chitinophagaceae bacterium]